MKRITVKSGEEFHKKIAALKPEADLFSFDIFDTLLMRRIEPPEEVHEALCIHISRHIQDRISPRDLLCMRREAELGLRRKAGRAGLDFECHYIDLLEEWTEKIYPGGDEGLLLWIRDMELSLEISALYARRSAAELLADLKASSKIIIAASDMYLGPNEIEAILEAKGIRQFFDRIYVSSTSCVCKYSGGLFRQIIRDHGVSPERMVHIGDNHISDVAVPSDLGITSVFLKEKEEKRRRRVLSVYSRLGARKRYWRGKHLLEILALNEDRQDHKDFYYRYGYKVLGPIFSVFSLGVFEKLTSKNIEKVFFLARDGYLLQKLHGILIRNLSRTELKDIQVPDVEYAYLTRKTVSAACAHSGIDHSLATLALYNPKQQGIYSILKAFGLSVDEFIPDAKRHGFKSIRERLSDWNDPRLINFLEDEDVKQKIKSLSAKNFEYLREYLEQIGFFSHKKVALVDIGWNGTIQHFISRLFSGSDNYPECSGLYFSFCAGIPYEFSGKDRLEGIFFDRNRMRATEDSIMAFEELFEEAARSLQATTIAYSRDPETRRIIPVYKDDRSPDRKAETACNPLVASLQEGILEFAGVFFETLGITGYNFADLKPFMLSLAERAVVYPEIEEVEKLSLLAHTEDWGYDNILSVNVHGEMSGHKPGLIHLRRIIMESNWKYGTIRKRLGRFFVSMARTWDIMRQK